MRGLSKLLMGVVVLLKASSAFADDRLRTSTGRALPNDTELKAAYCLVAVGEQRATMVQLVAVLGRKAAVEPNPRIAKTLSDAVRESKAHIQELDQRIARLSAFLLPRRKYLDSQSLINAMDRAKADGVATNNASKQCHAGCDGGSDVGKCMTDCTAQGEAFNRILQCADLRFLPY